MPSETRTVDDDFVEMTDEERKAFIREARKKLPEIDRRYAKAMANLKRISQGLRPIR